MPEYFFDYLDEYGNFERRKWLELGKRHGREIAETDYPYAVHRERSGVEELADRQFLTWWGELTRCEPSVPSVYRDRVKAAIDHFLFTSDHGDGRKSGKWSEAQRLYDEAFIGTYLEVVAKKDEAARPKVQPQPAAQPATSTTGATITITKAEHTGDIHRYWLKLEDPSHLDESYEFPDIPVLRIDFSEAPATDTARLYAPSSASSSFGEIASSSSKIVPLPESRSKTPQRKNPRISWEK